MHLSGYKVNFRPTKFDSKFGKVDIENVPVTQENLEKIYQSERKKLMEGRLKLQATTLGGFIDPLRHPHLRPALDEIKGREVYLKHLERVRRKFTRKPPKVNV